MVDENSRDGGEQDPWRLPAGDEVEEHDQVPIDTSVAQPARMYDYYLGGKTNFAADRAAAEQVIAVVPQIRDMARMNRVTMGRAVRYMARRGIRQFLDIGTGIPTFGNTHEVAQGVDPTCRVAYVDNDPIVLAHARALLAGDSRGATSYTEADLRDPEGVLASPGVREVVDLDRPVGLLLVAVLHFIRDEEKPERIVATLRDALPSGSMLLLTHVTLDFDPETARRGAAAYDRATSPAVPRTREQVVSLFDGFDLVEPGVVVDWNPDDEVNPEVDAIDRNNVWSYGGVAIKP